MSINDIQELRTLEILWLSLACNYGKRDWVGWEFWMDEWEDREHSKLPRKTTQQAATQDNTASCHARQHSKLPRKFYAYLRSCCNFIKNLRTWIHWRFVFSRLT